MTTSMPSPATGTPVPAPAQRVATEQPRAGTAEQPRAGTAEQPQAGAVLTADPRSGPILDVVIPVYNEENDLAPCVRRLHGHLRNSFPYPFQITIADNASTDSTLGVAMALEGELAGVRVVHLDAKGRGRALRSAWSMSSAPVLAYMDVDLSTDLAALLPLVAPLISGHSDLAIGTRLARTSRVVRGPRREVISRCYNLILRGTLAARFSDAQCGFKAIRADAASALLPLVEDAGWFFDTELLVLAERAGMRIHEVPVDWVDDPDSRVDVVATALADLKGVVRLLRAFGSGALPLADLRREFGRGPLTTAAGGTLTGGPSAHDGDGGPAAAPGIGGGGVQVPGVPRGLAGQLLRFAAIGVASTLAYLLLFVLLRTATGPQAANLLALLITAVANTAANRRLTFGLTGAHQAGRHHLQGLVVFAIGLGLTSGSLALLHAGSDHPGRGLEVTVLVLANLLSTIIRFLLMRAWVFRPRPATVAPERQR
ncbi:Glycosyl transferase [Frankia canadensis]|uniref:dolichyl-phosphate beta-glucosyltransferase n=1 Tax=Frankia canadensis TaxID=1836972 RepID=A0A2I2KWT6_9ACTN|nr:bifunctional glycosyltransferase family 2/GtrA family protein [Frankia canadensis]SNQ50120.1 Glycosyl transferase [Frankia canadensis]SOU57410.1 Glycosyl transferase [Frankia canadensis]